jgi:PPOX class probable F420-dependent enzyme
MTALSGAVADFIGTARVGRLGTVDAVGQPLVVPICYAFDGSALFSAIDAKPKRSTGRDLKRVRNIAGNPRVSVAIDHYEEDWSRLRYVIVQGHAELLESGEEYGRGVDMLRAKYPQYELLGLDRNRGLMIKVVPQSILSWSLSP